MHGLGRTVAPWLLALATGPIMLVSQTLAQGAEAPAHCAAAASGYIDPIVGVLPVNQGTGERHLAMFAMPYAIMAENAGDRQADELGPYGFFRGPNSNRLFADRGRGELIGAAISGFYATTFIHCRERAIVIVYGATSNVDPRDWITGIFRHYAGGESDLALAFYDAVRERYPGYAITLVGQSSGGGLASYVGALTGLPSVVFNPVRTDASLLNDGHNQLIVRITGDVLSDSTAPPARGVMRVTQHLTQNDGEVQGTLLLIDPIGEYRFLWELHWIETIIAEMGWIID